MRNGTEIFDGRTSEKDKVDKIGLQKVVFKKLGDEKCWTSLK